MERLVTKKYFFLIILTLFSCSSTEGIIENYIIKEGTSKQVYVFDKKESFSTVFEYLNGSFDSIYFGKYKGFSKKEYDDFFYKYTTDSTNINAKWNNNSFKTDNITVIDEDDYATIVKLTLKGGYDCFYKFSDVFMNDKKDKCFFYVTRAKKIGNIQYVKIIILNKKNKKWFVVDEFIPGVLY